MNDQARNETDTGNGNGQDPNPLETVFQETTGMSLDDADRAMRKFVNARPLVAVGLALATGYVIARVVNGRRR